MLRPSPIVALLAACLLTACTTWNTETQPKQSFVTVLGASGGGIFGSQIGGGKGNLAGDETDLLPHDLDSWRYDRSLDQSPWFDDATTEPSTERLFAECDELEALGFSRPPPDPEAA